MAAQWGLRGGPLRSCCCCAHLCNSFPREWPPGWPGQQDLPVNAELLRANILVPIRHFLPEKLVGTIPQVVAQPAPG